MEDKKGITNIDTFQTILDEQINEIMIVAARFIRAMKNKNYKHMNGILKTVYIDKLDEIVDKYNSTYYRKVKTKHAKLNSDTYIDYGVEDSDEDSKFKIGDDVKNTKIQK